MSPSASFLAGKVALVTGASRGIGAETAVALASAGAHVILTGRTEGGLMEVEDRIHAQGGTATIAPADIMEGDKIDGLAQAIANRWGRLDILVLNAAWLGALSPLSHITPKDWDKLISTNITAPYRYIRAFDGLLRASAAGRVIGLTSSVARSPRAYWGPYGASKAALEALLLSYAEEVANITSIKVAIVDPGATRTAMRKDAFPGEDPSTLKGPEVVANAIIGLLQAEFGTGMRLELGKKA